MSSICTTKVREGGYKLAILLWLQIKTLFYYLMTGHADSAVHKTWQPLIYTSHKTDGLQD